MKTEKSRKLRGSVLFTVVFVMSILIVLLFATLSLAVASNNRAHVNYTSTQAGITARTITDSAITALGGDKTVNADYKLAIASLNKANYDNFIKENPNTPFKYEAFADYSDGDADSRLKSMGYYKTGDTKHAGKIDIEYVGQRPYYDDGQDEWVYRDVLKFTSEVELGGVTKSSTAYVMKHAQGASVNNRTGGAGFVSAATASLDNRTNVYGGTYINVPNGSDAQKLPSNYYDGTYTGFKDVRVYNRDTDDNHSTYKPDGTWIEADAYICDNLSIEQMDGFVYPSLGTGVTILGDLKMVDEKSKFGIEPLFTVANDVELDFKEIPYFFVNGKLQYVCGGHIAGGKNMPLNIFCGTFDSRGGQPYELYADIFCMNENGESYFVKGNATTLYKWSGSWTSEYEPTTKKTSGNIYSKGSVYLEDVSIEGDVRVEGDCYIKGTVKVGGDLIVGGSVFAQGATLTTKDNVIYTDSASGGTGTYKKVNTITHSGKVDLTQFGKIEAQKRGYFTFTTTDHYYEDQWSRYKDGTCDMYGNKIDDYNNTTYYYMWKETTPYSVTPEQLYNEDGTVKIAEVEKYVNLGSETKAGETNVRAGFNPIDGNSEYYYVMAYPNRETLSEWTYQPFYYCDADNNEVDPKDEADYKTIADINGADTGERTSLDYVWYDVATGQRVSEFTASNSGSSSAISGITYKSLADFYGVKDNNGKFTNKYIYPPFAERGVLFGFDAVNKETGAVEKGWFLKSNDDKSQQEIDKFLDKSDTQVVMTVADILKKVRLYDYENIGGKTEYTDPTTGLKEIKPNITKYISSDEYAAALTRTINSGDALKKFSSNIIAEQGSNFDPVKDENGNWQEIKYNIVPKNTAGTTAKSDYFLIDKSCTLTGGINLNGHIVIAPSDDEDVHELDIVISGQTTIDNIEDIIIYDANGKKVNIYMKPGAKLNIRKGNIITTRYLSVFKRPDVTAIKYHCDNTVEGYDIGNVGAPNLNIYGAKGSEFLNNNAKIITANFLSCEMKVGIYATSNEFYGVKKYTYDNREIYNEAGANANFVFGTLTAGSIDIDNIFKATYIDDGGAGGGGAAANVNNKFWYKVLYYVDN